MIKELLKLMSEVEGELLQRRCWHPSEGEREDARRRLLLSIDLHGLAYECLYEALRERGTNR